MVDHADIVAEASAVVLRRGVADLRSDDLEAEPL
jgi:hypothetical protein